VAEHAGTLLSPHHRHAGTGGTTAVTSTGANCGALASPAAKRVIGSAMAKMVTPGAPRAPRAKPRRLSLGWMYPTEACTARRYALVAGIDAARVLPRSNVK